MAALFVLKQLENGGDWRDAIDTLKVDYVLGMPSDAIAPFITDDPEEICARQTVFADCISNSDLTDGFGELLEHISNIRDIREKERTYLQNMERTLYSVRVIEIYMDAIALADKLYISVSDKLLSERLKAFLANFHEVFISEQYKQIGEYVRRCLENAQTVKSFTVGINLDAKLEPVEIGILSMNEEAFVTSNFFTDLFSPADRTLQHVTPMIRFSGKNELLRRSMYLSMNDYLCKSVTKAFRDILKNMDEITHSLLSAENDLRFICRACAYTAELQESRAPFCFAMPSARACDVRDAYSPILLKRMRYTQIVPNDIRFDKDGISIHILTGANSGGKSVYIQTVGITQILFQLGLCVPAASANLRPLQGIYTHFVTDCGADYTAGDSRFVAECKQMKQVIEKLTADSMVLMDESFSGTAAVEGAAVAAQVLKHIRQRQCFCVYSTHIHEVVLFMDDLNRKKQVVAPMCVGMENGARTFKILFGKTDELSHAYDIAKKYGLDFMEEEE